MIIVALVYDGKILNREILDESTKHFYINYVHKTKLRMVDLIIEIVHGFLIINYIISLCIKRHEI